MTYTLDRGTPRIAREITDAPLTVRVNGTVVPWDRHTAVTITREARHGESGNSHATAQVTITADTLTDLPKRSWLLIDLTAAAATALAAPTSSRYRFAGRLTDVALIKPSPTAPARYELIAAGTLASLHDPAYPIASTGWAPLTALASTAETFPPSTHWPTVGYELDYTGTITLPPGTVSDVYGTPPPLRDALATVVDSHPAALLAEYRDGSIRFTDTGHGTVATVPAPAALAFPRTWPVNEATVTYGPAPAGYTIARNLVPNPRPSGATTGWTASGGTVSSGLGYVQLSQTNTANEAYMLAGGLTGSYDHARDGKLLARWGIDVAPDSTGTATVEAWHRIGTTTVLVETLGTIAGNTDMFSWANSNGTAVVEPASDITSVRFGVRVPAGWVDSGEPALRVEGGSLITMGHGDDVDASTWVATADLDFTGATADGDGFAYEWEGTTANSTSLKKIDSPQALTVTARDASSITTYGLNPATRRTLMFYSYHLPAYALAEHLLTGSTWEPPPITLDVLALLADGQDALARALLALELGARIAVTSLPADTPQDLTDPTACYVAGLRETIAPGSWRLTITPALIPD